MNSISEHDFKVHFNIYPKTYKGYHSNYYSITPNLPNDYFNYVVGYSNNKSKWYGSDELIYLDDFPNFMVMSRSIK